MKCSRVSLRTPRRPEYAGDSPKVRECAFTLLEVMVAMAIFFLAVFAILQLVAQNLEIAHSLTFGEADMTTVAAEIAQTNQLSEGTMSGDFGAEFPGATWTADIHLAATNSMGLATSAGGRGLFEADITIDWPQNGLEKERHASILLYRIGAKSAGSLP